MDLPDSGLRRAFERGRNVLPIEGDVRDEDAATDAVKALLRRFGRLDGVISNAAIMIRK
jgi:NAD(P)-dependent dehydrogenase (short-subunit alcohol dehydrogenase family)